MVSDETLYSGDAFSYACNRCRRCCAHKRIRVNPYEVWRLARSRGMSTTQFLAEHTVAGGTELAARADGTCVFLGPEGCEVHADRPLVCRLYPLGRSVTRGEPDRFFHLAPHPETEGTYGTAETVAAYLDAQGAVPFMRAADRYLECVVALADAVSVVAARDPVEGEAARAALHAETQAAAHPAAGSWLDIDVVLAATADASAPASAEEAMDRHIAALDAWRRSLLNPGGTS